VASISGHGDKSRHWAGAIKLANESGASSPAASDRASPVALVSVEERRCTTFSAGSMHLRLKTAASFSKQVDD
jgi:hypothetical protein